MRRWPADEDCDRLPCEPYDPGSPQGDGPGDSGARARSPPARARPTGGDPLRALTVMVPRVKQPPALTTVHDVLHRVHPAFFSRAELAYGVLPTDGLHRRAASCSHRASTRETSLSSG